MLQSYESNIWKFYLFKIAGALELTISIFVLFMLSNNLTMTQVMVLETLFIIVLLVLEIPSGAFADLFGRKLSLALSMVAASIGFIIFGLGTGFWVFLLAQIIVAISWALASGADSALLYDSLKEMNEERKYAKLFGRGNSFALFTWAASALIGGVLAVYLGYRNLFFITALFFFMGSFIALWLKEPPIHKTVYEKNIISHLKGALKFSFEHKIIRNIIIYYGVFAALTHLAWFLIQPFYDQSSLPKYFVGIATFLFFLFAGLGNLTAERFIKNIKEESLLLSLLFIASASLMGLFFVSKLFALALVSLIPFVGGIRDIFVNKEINMHTSSHHRATVISIQSSAKSLMYAIFAPIIGYLTDVFSPKAAFLAMGLGLFIFFCYYLVLAIANDKNI